LGFRLGCPGGDPILVLLLKFDAQIEKNKEKINLKKTKNLFESLMPPIIIKRDKK
jgi:hypothetical protein